MVKDLFLIVDDDPEWLTIPVPSIVPVEVSIQRQDDFEDCARDWLIVNLHVDVRQVAEILEQLVLVDRRDVIRSFVELPLVKIVHANTELIKTIDCCILYVSVFRDILVWVCQFAHRASLGKLTHRVRVRHDSLVHDLSPLERYLC